MGHVAMQEHRSPSEDILKKRKLAIDRCETQMIEGDLLEQWLATANDSQSLGEFGPAKAEISAICLGASLAVAVLSDWNLFKPCVYCDHFSPPELYPYKGKVMTSRRLLLLSNSAS